MQGFSQLLGLLATVGAASSTATPPNPHMVSVDVLVNGTDRSMWSCKIIQGPLPGSPASGFWSDEVEKASHHLPFSASSLPPPLQPTHPSVFHIEVECWHTISHTAHTTLSPLPSHFTSRLVVLRVSCTSSISNHFAAQSTCPSTATL
jgi:hypothetical protein